MSERFSLSDIFLKAGKEFHSSHISTSELEGMLKDVVKREHPGRKIKEFTFNKGGAEVVLDNNQVIEIEVDWNEIILS